MSNDQWYKLDKDFYDALDEMTMRKMRKPNRRTRAQMTPAEAPTSAIKRIEVKPNEL